MSAWDTGPAWRANHSPTPEVEKARKDRLRSRDRAHKALRKPCPGCGEIKRYHPRPTDEVCDDCLTLIWEAEDARFEKQIAKVKPSDELLRIGVRRWSDTPAWPRWSPRGGYHAVRDECARFSTAIADLLYRLLERGVLEGYAQKDGRLVPQNIGKGGMPPTYTVIAPSGVGDIIEEVDAAAHVVFDAIYVAGVDDGRAFLAQLSKGEITLDDFYAGKERR